MSHDVHVMPSAFADFVPRMVEGMAFFWTHAPEGSCWCKPRMVYDDEATGGRVWVHRRRSVALPVESYADDPSTATDY